MAIYESSMSSKYQVTIPLEVREGLGIKSPDYDIVWMKTLEGGVTVYPRKKLQKGENPFFRMYGVLAEYGNGHEVDDFIKEKRAEALKENL